MRIRHLAGTLVVPLVLVAGTAAAAPIGYALGNGGTELLRFDVASPDSVASVGLSGDGSRLDAIDFRPATGELFGYDDASDLYFLVDPLTGALTDASGTISPTDTGNLDIDWNPTIDRMRTVTESDQNIVYNPNTGDASDAATTPLFFGAGDPNDGTDPNVTANAYSNSFAGAVTTTQYVLDHELDILATLANNAGTLTTVGSLGLDIGAAAGLDIFSVGGSNIAYALLNVGGTPGLYTIDLATGAATPIGTVGGIGQFNDITALAIADVPVPASITLLAAALGLGLCWRGARRPAS